MCLEGQLGNTPCMEGQQDWYQGQHLSTHMFSWDMGLVGHQPPTHNHKASNTLLSSTTLPWIPHHSHNTTEGHLCHPQHLQVCFFSIPLASKEWNGPGHIGVSSHAVCKLTWSTWHGVIIPYYGRTTWILGQHVGLFVCWNPEIFFFFFAGESYNFFQCCYSPYFTNAQVNSTIFKTEIQITL